MNDVLKKILFKMNDDAQSQGKPLPFPPTKEGHQKLLRMIGDLKKTQLKKKVKNADTGQEGQTGQNGKTETLGE